MGPLELVLKLARLLVAARRRIEPYWRWGHGYAHGSSVCLYCDRYDPEQQRVTNPPCPGPSRERAAMLKRRSPKAERPA